MGHDRSSPLDGGLADSPQQADHNGRLGDGPLTHAPQKKRRMSVTHIVSDFSREVALHLELLEVFGEIDWAGIKLLHLVYIMMPVRVIVSS